MKPIIEAKELSCFYGVVLGLNNVSFTINEGITGLVGPNGAGKSTLIKLITGQLKPSSGSLSVMGEDPWNHLDVLARIGYCPEHECIHKELRPIDWLRSLAVLSGIPWKKTKAISEKALEVVQLPSVHWNKKIGAYSKGMRQRVKLAQAILHEPELVILDEPMNGLDPMGRREMGKILKDLRSQGVDIIISSHILHELETLCGSFLMLNWGRVLASGRQTKIREDIKNWSETLAICSDNPQQLADHLLEGNHLKGFLIEGNQLLIWLRDPKDFSLKWTEYLADCDVVIQSIENKSQSLSHIFEKITV